MNSSNLAPWQNKFSSTKKINGNMTHRPSKQFNTYKEGLDLEFFDDRSGKLITCGSTSWSMWRYLSNHKAKQ